MPLSAATLPAGFSASENGLCWNDTVQREEYPMRHVRKQIVGKTITGVITRNAGRGRNPSLVMLQFSDGSYFEFVSPAALKALRKSAPDSLIEHAGMAANELAQAPPQLAISGM
jgi:hypothetical protein